MSNHPHPVSVFHAFANSGSLPCHGGGGTAIIIWFEEIIAFAAEFISVIVISLMAGLIYLFKTCVFKSAMPRSDDLKK